MKNDKSNQATHDIWNGEAGEDWAQNQRDLDFFLEDPTQKVLGQLPLTPEARVLEIGSGSGTMSMDMGRLVDQVLGLDVSRELIALARRRVAAAGLKNVTFRDLDIQTQALDETGFDICTAQFGMMFFSDPVLAFSHIRDHLKSGAVMAFDAWAGHSNPWFSMPLAVAERYLGPLPVSEPSGPPAPGPLAFADVTYVTGLLEKAGYTQINGWEEDIVIRHPGGLEALMHSIRYVGPISTLYRLKQPDAAMRTRIADDIRREFAQFETPDGGVAVPGRITMFRCLAP